MKLDSLPVATIVHLLVSLAVTFDYVIDQQLSPDAATYAGLVLGGNGLVAIGRGLAAKKGT